MSASEDWEATLLITISTILGFILNALLWTQMPPLCSTQLNPSPSIDFFKRSDIKICGIDTLVKK